MTSVYKISLKEWPHKAFDALPAKYHDNGWREGDIMATHVMAPDAMATDGSQLDMNHSWVPIAFVRIASAFPFRSLSSLSRWHHLLPWQRITRYTESGGRLAWHYILWWHDLFPIRPISVIAIGFPKPIIVLLDLTILRVEAGCGYLDVCLSVRILMCVQLYVYVFIRLYVSLCA